MFPLPKTILERLYILADIAEEEGAAAIYSSNEFPFSVSQASLYRKHFEGLKRFIQMDSINQNLFEEDSPYYGWGSLIFLDPVVVMEHDCPDIDLKADKATRKKIAKIRAETPGRMEVYKRNQKCPSIGMWIIRATLSPILIPEIPLKHLQTRCSRLQGQVRDAGIREKLRQLKFYQRPNGVWAGRATYTIEKIT